MNIELEDGKHSTTGPTSCLEFDLHTGAKRYEGTLNVPDADETVTLPMMVNSLMVSLARDCPEIHDATEMVFNCKFGEPDESPTMAQEIEDFRGRKEPWASCCTVAINRAIRKFIEEGGQEGTMSSIMEIEDEGFFVQLVALVTNRKAKYSFESLGIEDEDLFAP